MRINSGLFDVYTIKIACSCYKLPAFLSLESADRLNHTIISNTRAKDILLFNFFLSDNEKQNPVVKNKKLYLLLSFATF